MWTSNEIEGSIFHSMFLCRFVAHTELYLSEKNGGDVSEASGDLMDDTTFFGVEILCENFCGLMAVDNEADG